jgi:tetratricopeptide (TPR) repeat protein
MQSAITPSSPPPVPDIDQELRELQQQIEQRRFDDALHASDRLLSYFPRHRDLLYMRAVALRHLGRVPDALATLDTLEDTYPTYPRLFQERGHCHVFLRQAPQAIQAFTRAVELNPALPASWRMLASLYTMTGRTSEAENAARHVAKLATLAVEVVTARSMLADGNLSEAEALIRPYVKRVPDDIEGLRVFALIAQQSGFSRDAAIVLEEVMAKDPTYHAARQDLVAALLLTRQHVRAREQLEILMQAQPDAFAHRRTLASILVSQGSTAEAIDLFRELLQEHSNDADLHMYFGHALKTQGIRAEAEHHYREAVRHRPSFGEAYWSMANLKTYRFSDQEIADMRRQVEAPRIPLTDRYHLCFALGKAYEDVGNYEESFRYYARGNDYKKAESTYRIESLERTARKQAELCTREFFEQRQGFGCNDPAPIFIVGLPRAGSTLLEQILASHSQVEGTMELADIPRLVSSIALHPSGARYPGALALLSADDYRGYGENYIRDTRLYRVTNKPFFIDKLPNNFRHLGLIHLMLPNAKIIDARREAMACCFSNFKQLFALGQQFTYGLEDIGRYYSLYVRLMDHWNSALPGRILRVQHEDVIDDLEGSVRRILDYCGLEFEPACVEFHKTERRVHTASSEQVRRPINREGVDQWKNFEPWLGPLREALGPLAAP